MRVLKLALLTIVIFGTLILALSFLFPSRVRISRAINIGAPKEVVNKHVRDLRKWPAWNEMINQQELTTRNSTDSIFSSDQMTVRLVSASPDAIITNWTRGQNQTIHSGINLMTGGDSTIVQWYFDFKLKWYPWEKFGSIIFDKQLGPGMEASLGNLKKFIEDKQ